MKQGISFAHKSNEIEIKEYEQKGVNQPFCGVIFEI
jgi:hypothetical protein